MQIDELELLFTIDMLVLHSSIYIDSRVDSVDGLSKFARIV